MRILRMRISPTLLHRRIVVKMLVLSIDHLAYVENKLYTMQCAVFRIPILEPKPSYVLAAVNSQGTFVKMTNWKFVKNEIALRLWPCIQLSTLDQCCKEEACMNTMLNIFGRTDGKGIDLTKMVELFETHCRTEIRFPQITPLSSPFETSSW